MQIQKHYNITKIKNKGIFIKNGRIILKRTQALKIIKT